jgi:hypothetical protein
MSQEQFERFAALYHECSRALTSSGAERIAIERGRQITAEYYDAGHDDEINPNGELLDAARAYIFAATGVPAIDPSIPPMGWPWDAIIWKPASRIRMLEKAGSLVAAEIDRLLRAGEKA